MNASRYRRRAGIAVAVGLILIGLWGAWCLRSAQAPKRVTVLAASSLTDAFSALAKGFEARYPDTQVELVFAGSQVLRMQVQAGAPGDVIATAHPEHLLALRAAGHAEPAQSLARNRLALIVANANDAMPWQSAIELPRWILGSSEVPVGRYAEELFVRMAAELGPDRLAKLKARVLSREPNVRMVRTKIEMGQADAAVVYASDLRPGVAVREIPLPASLEVKVDYQIALLRGAKQRDDAKHFVDFARSKPGQAILMGAGFLARQEAL